MVLAIHEDGNKEDSCQAESFMRFSSIYISLFLLHKTHTSIKVLRYFPIVCRHTHTHTCHRRLVHADLPLASPQNRLEGRSCRTSALERLYEHCSCRFIRDQQGSVSAEQLEGRVLSTRSCTSVETCTCDVLIRNSSLPPRKSLTASLPSAGTNERQSVSYMMTLRFHLQNPAKAAESPTSIKIYKNLSGSKKMICSVLHVFFFSTHLLLSFNPSETQRAEC